MAPYKPAKLTIHRRMTAFLCSHPPDLAVKITTKKPTRRGLHAASMFKIMGTKSHRDSESSRQKSPAVLHLPHSPRHNVPPPARRMALQTQAKHLGILPRRHRALTHAQRHRTQQTALRSLRHQIHPHALRPHRRRVPQLLLQILVLLGRPGRDV